MMFLWLHITRVPADVWGSLQQKAIIIHLLIVVSWENWYNLQIWTIGLKVCTQCPSSFTYIEFLVTIEGETETTTATL